MFPRASTVEQGGGKRSRGCSEEKNINDGHEVTGRLGRTRGEGREERSDGSRAGERHQE